jgi:hypothetical protein
MIGVASGSFEVTWAVLELNLGIVCACIVLMRPLLHSCRAFLGHYLSRGKDSSVSGSSTRIGVIKSKESFGRNSVSQQGELVE